MGFAGCTTYFSTLGGKNGIKLILQTNVSSVLWATVEVVISELISDGFIETCMACIVSFILCMHSKFKNFHVYQVHLLAAFQYLP
ncbi:MAG: DUF1097 domain-containing protein [Clostridiales bacterium]|nr:DUF1097 domain-containing protein [Clostridiales bacterium]